MALGEKYDRIREECPNLFSILGRLMASREGPNTFIRTLTPEEQPEANRVIEWMNSLTEEEFEDFQQALVESLRKMDAEDADA
jgi:hypothetical protein